MQHKGPEYHDLFMRMLRCKYAEYQPRVIIACDQEVVDLLLKNRDALFPDIPIVFCGVHRLEKLGIVNGGRKAERLAGTGGRSENVAP
jgi:hypothetical protein